MAHSKSALADTRPAGVSLAVVAALFIASLTLRPQLLAIGPLLPLIRADLGLPASVAGLLTTIPVLCMGLFAPFGPRIAARLGPRTGFAMCIAAIAGLGMLRALAPAYPLVLLATFGIGVAIGVAGAIPSMVVSQRLPTRPALGTGAYAAGITAGSALSAAIAVPLAVDGNWRLSLLVLSAAALLSLVGWLLLVPDDRANRRNVRAVRLPWRSGTAWLLAVVFGLQSVLFYGSVAWLPNAFVERGWSPAEAGALVAISNGVGLFSTIGIPLVADRFAARRPAIVLASSACVVALTALAGVPALAYPAVIVLGLSLGSLLPLVLTLPLDVSGNPANVGSVAALMLLGGYVISSTGPFVLGAVRDATGSFAASLWLLVAAAIALTAMTLFLSPARLRRGVREAV
jgi:MFS transporter, CP family, cyanate transporter